MQIVWPSNFSHQWLEFFTIAHVRFFIDMIMTSWNYGDFDDYEDIEQTLREKRNKQKDWRKRMNTAHEEMIKKWKN